MSRLESYPSRAVLGETVLISTLVDKPRDTKGGGKQVLWQKHTNNEMHKQMIHTYVGKMKEVP